jgi:pyruvate formate lyase activating enzyme
MVFDIQKYSLHDGPGIRTIVFLKGCPLKCKWCSNPESQYGGQQLFFVKSRCIKCGRCVKECKNNEVELTSQGISINWEKVDWAKVCPTNALTIKGRLMSVDEVVSAVMKDEIFYRQSGGGITLSGGEPLLQSEFCLQLLKKLKEVNISTAVETTGAVPKDVLEAVVPYVDLFLYDYKHCKNEEHIKYIGSSKDLIMSNLVYLSYAKANIMVRTPLIPGVNDSDECINQILDQLKNIGIDKYNVLPFHQYGSGKYDSIGMQYEFSKTRVLPQKRVKEIRRLIKSKGFHSSF